MILPLRASPKTRRPVAGPPPLLQSMIDPLTDRNGLNLLVASTENERSEKEATSSTREMLELFSYLEVARDVEGAATSIDRERSQLAGLLHPSKMKIERERSCRAMVAR
ncbi:hypothetical protein JCGZ_25250 [Jatropha curcas]|uniref:Uncharacterized protein n=1 Tax=Jatropha curcas TaxID=180498 RepID=A0A067LFZ7_JATCU|nr:hypothetical protein JCGZ_25250 [Jatropha curcas]